MTGNRSLIRFLVHPKTISQLVLYDPRALNDKIPAGFHVNILAEDVDAAVELHSNDTVPYLQSPRLRRLKQEQCTRSPMHAARLIEDSHTTQLLIGMA